MPNNEGTFCLCPLAYDYLNRGRGGTRARCDILVEWAQVEETLPEKRNWFFFLSAGYTKASPTTPTIDVPVSLAAQMEMYLTSQDIPGEKIICAPDNELVFGTYEECRALVTLIKNTGIENPVLYFSTNMGHIPRVFICFWFLVPRKWKIRFAPAPHSFTRKEYWQETIKFFVYIYRFLFKKW